MPELQHHRKEVLFIQFAKSPRPGQVKTRMQPWMNADQACALHCELLLWTSLALTSAGLADVEMWQSGDSKHPIFKQCRGMGVMAIHSQQGIYLGERMYHAITHGLRRYQKVILVGSDCPQIDAGYLSSAVLALDHKPLVLGPATDGGYVLIGATRIHAKLFEGVTWGESSVYAQTLERIGKIGEQYVELGMLSDIDRPEDLPLWEAVKKSGNFVVRAGGEVRR